MLYNTTTLKPTLESLGMKNLLLGCLLLFCMPSWATSKDQFQITITNTLATDCRLQDQTILYGHISDHTMIPTVIHPNTTETFMMRSGPRYRVIYKDKSILLTYICDNDQDVTLYSNNNNKSDAKTLNVTNMSATFKISDYYTKHSEIHWSLSY